jgi:hypothetical protein
MLVPTARIVVVDAIAYAWEHCNPGRPLPEALGPPWRKASAPEADDPAAVRNREHQRRHRERVKLRGASHRASAGKLVDLVG